MRVGAPAYACEADEIVRAFASDADTGLTAAEARARLARHGPNRLGVRRRASLARLLAHQFVDPLVLLLVAAAVVSAGLGDLAEGAAIAAVLVLNGSLGLWQEAKAERAILALSRSLPRTAAVVRGGAVLEIPADEVVPGDLLVVQEGERVAADGRVVSEQGLEVDEAALTGESLPVGKRAAASPSATPLAERTSMVYSGTAVTRGHGRVVVSATGRQTELGRIESLTSGARPPATPLTRRLARLTRGLVAGGVALVLVLGGAMLLRGEPAHEAFLVAVAVAVAAVPEGLAATVTAALALGARAMARRGAIVRRLTAIETLGATTVVCTDKTGTLTENSIRVAALAPAAGVGERELLAAAVLASSRAQGLNGTTGDPIERALLRAAVESGGGVPEPAGGRTLVRELPFDSDRRRMTVLYEEGGRLRAYMKGAPETVCERAAPARELSDRASAWAEEGYRVLAVSARDLDPGAEAIEIGHELLGVVALHDPLRVGAATALARAATAGIEVRMVTGDHPATAQTIARQLGLPAGAVTARATPVDKLRLVERLQADGAVVAVTGDGVNDAPALRRADVGVAMGRSGTEAAREAADIVLTDDDFATILAAVEEGRRIGDNIRKVVGFLLSANLGEVAVFGVAIAVGLPAPLAVIQVLFVNLVTDGLPAVALARDPADALTMQTPPRRGAQLFDRATWAYLGAVGLLVGAVTLIAFLALRGPDERIGQTGAFLTLAVAELALVFGLRSRRVAAWRLPVNRWLGWSVAASVIAVLAAVYLPAAQAPFATVALGPAQLATAVGLAVLPLAAVEAWKSARRDQ